MKQRKKEHLKGWAIGGDYGLYYGIWPYRNDAIAHHCSCYNPSVKARMVGHKLNETQKQEWKIRKADGDRAVKVTMITDGGIVYRDTAI